MNRRERFENVVNHKKVDKAIFDLYGSPQTMVCDDKTTEKIKELLNINGNYSGDNFYDERILEKLDIDTRMTGGFPFPESKLQETFKNRYVDSWGIEYTFVNGHYEISKNPLKDTDIDDLNNYCWPDPDTIDDSIFEGYKKHAKMLFEETDYIVCAQHPVYGVFELGCWMYGFDDFLYRMAAEPELVHKFFNIILQYQKKIIKRYYSALGSYIHCTTSGDDFGTQNSMFMSVNMFREMIMPYFKERIAYTKSFTNAYFMHHTCGSVFEIIPSLIECGVDILNPIQPGAYKMEPEALKETYNNSISFWGGIDTQHLLVNGTVEQVKDEVKRILAIFDENGGYILSPAHCIQEDVPAENVIAIYEGANEFYKYKNHQIRG